MKKKITGLLLFVLIAIIPVLSQTYHNSLYSIEVGGGTSLPLGSTKDGWHTGVFSGADALYWPLQYLGAGLRFGFDLWLPDLEDRTKDIENLRAREVDGTSIIFEIVPSVRFTTIFKEPFNIFGQFGTGLFVSRQAVHEFGTTGPAETPFEINTVNDWTAKWGLQVGPGITFSNKYGTAIDIMHLYNVVFNHHNGTFNYFTTSISVRVNF